MTKDEKYIERCIQLAQNGLCNTPPNPTVGAVIVHKDRIIGEGYHVRYGEGHAEVNAIRSVKDERLLKESTIYVSLEPCAHYGKTPPCADLIIRKGIPRVVIGCTDPFSLVAGRGIRKLQDAGLDVKVGVLEEECRALIKPFAVFNIRKRPYVTLKWAVSADGFMDINRTGGSPVVLSSPLSSIHVHKQRAEHKAILIGRDTALLDNPSLTTRNWYGDNPIRVVLDKDLTLPENLKLFDGSIPTIVYNAKEDRSTHNLKRIRLNFEEDVIPQIMTSLFEQNIPSLLVEGGSILLKSFIQSEQWDEVFVEHAPAVLKEGIESPVIPSGYTCEFFSRDGRIISHFMR